MSAADGDDDSVECPTCDREFSSKKGRGIHHVRAHGEPYTITKACNRCGEEIERLPSKFPNENAYCSDGCLEAGFSEERTERVDVECANCDTVNEVKPSRAEDRENVFCDRDCQGEWLSENATGDQHPSWKGRVQVECGSCGGQIEKRECRVGDGSRHFCSDGCYKEWLAERWSGEKNPNFDPASRVTEECGFCGEEFEYRIASDKGDYCSRSCAMKDKTGEDHPNWEGGPVVYGSGWNDEKKERVRRRAKWRCEGCGFHNLAHLERFGRRLDVHHITPARQFEDPDQRNAVGNLAALCMPCHAEAERVAPHYPFAD